MKEDCDAINSGAWFAYVLSKIYPIEWMELKCNYIENDPFMILYFCWRFFEPDPATYERIEKAVYSFSGNIDWIVYIKNNCCCIVAVPYGMKLYPSLNLLNTEQDKYFISLEEYSTQKHNSSIVSKAIIEIPLLCQHIEKYLELGSIMPKSFDLKQLTQNTGCKISGNSKEAYIEHGMHVVWLVKDIEAFEKYPGPTSENDKSLDFSLTYPEWRALYFDVLNVGGEEYKDHIKSNPSSLIIEFNTDIPNYPMLSRIRGYLYDAVFRVQEVNELHQECLRVRANTSNALAIKGLEKLLQISNLAQRAELNIYFMCE